MNKLQVKTYRTPWRDGVDFLIAEFDYQGEVSAVAQPIQLTKRKPEEYGLLIDPTFMLTGSSAQQLMDELWNCGLRPTEGTGSAGALSATQKHLEDMRTLVFKGETK